MVLSHVRELGEALGLTMSIGGSLLVVDGVVMIWRAGRTGES
ncbi:hypothetical protein Q6350_05795 [Isoptericola sp. b515]|nr:hypothetical protein [Isoptericola sp. b515]MDO8147939.1 hypothetical protein [Isoptericola sp. b515]